ncbi:SDR family oxidoreductase [Mucilaginibacter limnophilus]|uniref:SDR family oxidoreductase n=1 Tax=Mucilaginibacter limnophilus TaxID=1932778 RepID=A0A3S2Y3X4_9SPHI|nr:SDR family oxidoreductase [Mucilaginibacter limnophilus]RVU01403.1 SDR family oxidoreductase [Mucilaginibacter limnophilus]
MTKKKVLITGASRGLGLAISKKLAADYTLILHASRQESFTTEIPGSYLLCADLADTEQLNDFCKMLKKEHGDDLYAVINNAGVTFDKPLMYQPEREIDAILNINLKAPIMICKTAMKIFSMNKTGVIINMSSVVGQTGNAFQAVYSATKAGMAALSRSLAQEAANIGEGHNIRVLSIAPGFIETDMTERIPAAEKEKYLNMIPAKRFGNVDDVAETVAFLLSDKASYINATSININGGLF